MMVECSHQARTAPVPGWSDAPDDRSTGHLGPGLPPARMLRLPYRNGSSGMMAVGWLRGRPSSGVEPRGRWHPGNPVAIEPRHETAMPEAFNPTDRSDCRPGVHRCRRSILAGRRIQFRSASGPGRRASRAETKSRLRATWQAVLQTRRSDPRDERTAHPAKLAMRNRRKPSQLPARRGRLDSGISASRPCSLLPGRSTHPGCVPQGSPRAPGRPGPPGRCSLRSSSTIVGPVVTSSSSRP